MGNLRVLDLAARPQQGAVETGHVLKGQDLLLRCPSSPSSEGLRPESFHSLWPVQLPPWGEDGRKA